MSNDTHSIQQIPDLIQGILEPVVNNPASEHAIQRILVGYSGGMDSTALLHAAKQFANDLNLDLCAIHVNHQVNADASQWQQHCEKTCADIEIPIINQSVDISDFSEGSLEARCRQARYRVFESIIESADLLLLAHHQSDVAETLLMNLFRGTGVRGLGAIPTRRPLGKGTLIRPLLGCSQAQIRAYCLAHDLDWIDDPSNSDISIRRNFVRHRLIPEIEQHWPQATANLQRCANLMQAHDETTRLLLHDELVKLSRAEDSSIDITGVMQLAPVLQLPLLRHWLDENHVSQPWYSHWQELLRQLKTERTDHQIEIRWPGGCLRVYRARLYIVQMDTEPLPTSELPFSCTSLDLPAGCGRIDWNLAAARNVELPDLVVRFDLGDRKILLHGHRQRARVRNLFQQAGVPPWERHRYPGVFLDSRLIAVGDVWKSQELIELEQQLGISLRWLRP